MSTTLAQNLASALTDTDRTRRAPAKLSIVEFDQWSIPHEARVEPTGGTWVVSAAQASRR